MSEVNGDLGQDGKSENIELTGTEHRNSERGSAVSNGVGIDNPAFSVSESDEVVVNGPQPTETVKRQPRPFSYKRVIIIEKDRGPAKETSPPDPDPPVTSPTDPDTPVEKSLAVNGLTPAVHESDEEIKNDDTASLPAESPLTDGHVEGEGQLAAPSDATDALIEVDTIQVDSEKPEILIHEDPPEESLLVAENVDTAIVAEEVHDASVAEEAEKAIVVEDAAGVIGPADAEQDDLVTIEGHTCCRADGGVKIRMADYGPASETPITVPSLLISTARSYPKAIAMATKVNTKWVSWTYRQYLDDVLMAAKAFLKLGLQPFHSVGILGFNSPEWFIAEVAAIFAGGLAVGIYTTNSAEAVGYVARHSKANILVVEDETQLEKVLAVRDTLPDLKAIIQYRGSPKQETDGLYAWSELAEIGREIPDTQVDEIIRQLSPNKACVIIYTSGTTGPPKGALLSHDNLTWTARMSVQHCRFRWTKEIAISYLPLSHIAAQLTDVFMSMVGAFTVYFAKPDALKGSLGETLKEVRPTVFLAVPRVWEKMQDRLMAIGKTTKGCKRKIATWAKGIGLRGNLARMRGERKPFMFGLANALVFKKVKKAMGLDRCRGFWSGAAPISRETLEYFMSLNIVINEIYGMSEITGPQTIGVPWSFLLGSVGSTVLGMETKILNTDEEGVGEICMRGRNAFMGYLHDEAKTKETVDEDGFVHSGDLGKFDSTGTHLHITGRIKELIITAGGENIAPVLIEDHVKSALPCVSNCMLIGDKRKFLAMLLTMRCLVNVDTLEPEDRLDPAAIAWCRALDSNITTVSGILETTDERIMKAIQTGIDQANTKAISRAQKIQKWTVLPQDFSIPGGELGPTLKLKRPVVLQKYHETIEAFYTET